MFSRQLVSVAVAAAAVASLATGVAAAQAAGFEEFSVACSHHEPGTTVVHWKNTRGVGRVKFLWTGVTMTVTHNFHPAEISGSWGDGHPGTGLVRTPEHATEFTVVLKDGSTKSHEIATLRVDCARA